MKIALIGATGFVGTAVLKEALDRGYQVTAIVRHPGKLSEKDKSLSVVKGDAMDTHKLSELIKGHDVVVSAYNAGWSNPDIYNEFLKGAQSIQEAVKQSGVKRLIVVGGAGSLFVAPNLQLIDTPEFPGDWKAGALAARDYLNLIKGEKELEWTYLSPAVEMNQGAPHERKGSYRTDLDQPVFDAGHRSFITVEDLAVAILDEVESPQHIRQRFTVGY
ncbi:MAG TPA: NAD(P)-dependent oxidoreductase [Chitinophagaceae bacterium]|jgi:putative NADH-flavin reductase|nr:NAD(P)-dependent oxidoreductase [Chitinophagaceae bacterium]